MSNYPETMAAMQADEINQWALSDALLKECGLDRGSYDKLMEVAAEALALFGREYTWNTLRRLRDTAKHYPPGTRFPGVSYTVHYRVTGGPELMKDLLARMKPGEKLTIGKAIALIRDSRGKAKEQLKEVRTKAQTELAWIEDTCGAMLREATTAKERAAAEKQVLTTLTTWLEKRPKKPTKTEAIIDSTMRDLGSTMAPQEEVEEVLADGDLLAHGRKAQAAWRASQRGMATRRQPVPPEVLAIWREVYAGFRDLKILADSIAERSVKSMA